MINQAALGGCSGPSLEDVIAGWSGPGGLGCCSGEEAGLLAAAQPPRPSHPVWVALCRSPGRLAGLPGHLSLEKGGCQDTLGSPDPISTHPQPCHTPAQALFLFTCSPSSLCSVAPCCPLNKPSSLKAIPQSCPISRAQLPWSPSPHHTHTCALQLKNPLWLPGASPPAQDAV